MVDVVRNLSVHQQLKRQRREQAVGAVGLIVSALVFGIALVLLTGPLPLVLGLAVLLFALSIALKPQVGLYVLLFCAIFLEQWGIVGLDPWTAQFPFYQTLAGSSDFPLPVSPVEIVLLFTLAVVLLPHIARRGVRFERGPLFVPLLLFLTFVLASIVYGVVARGGAGPFDLRAAWEETRAFFYLGITYVLASNLIRTRTHLRIFIWLFIAAIGLKSVQGVVRYIYVRSNEIQVDTIIGHEDVVFFAAFVVLVAALVLFGARLAPSARRQVRVMLIVLPPLILTLLVSNRRLGFVVLATGLILVAILLLRSRRELFLRLAPAAVLTLGIYIPLFWNGTGTLSAPIRAIRSIVAPTTERDRSSNAWRDLENMNIDYNVHSAPITGLGFGRPYSFIVAQPPLDATGFTYWRYIAHNAIYWVWMKMGLLGFIIFWYLLGSAVALGLTTFRQLRDGYLKAIALVVAAVVLMQVIFSYGDLGLTYSRSMIFLGCMLGALARLPSVADPAPEDSSVSTGRQPVLRGDTAPASSQDSLL